MQTVSEPYILKNLSLVKKGELDFPFQDYGFLYGYGVFETLRVHQKRPVLIDQHLRRLEYSAGLLEIPFSFSVEESKKAIQLLIEENQAEEAVLNIYLTPGDRQIGETKIRFEEPLYLAMLRPLPNPIPSQGLTIALREESFKRTRIDQIKSMSYMKNILEKRFAQPFDDVIVYDNNQAILETPTASVFVVKNNRILTPKSQHILPGITRQYLLDNTETWGIDIDEEVITVGDLNDCDEIFLSNAIRGIIPVESVEGLAALASGPITQMLSQKYHDSIHLQGVECQTHL